MLKSIRVIAGVLSMMAAMSSFAATQVTLNCTPPTTRTDNSPLALSELGNYFFHSIIPPATVEVPYPSQPACGYVVPIPKGSCFYAGTIFGVRASDKQGQLSDPATVALTADACNYLPKPQKPSNATLTVQ